LDRASPRTTPSRLGALPRCVQDEFFPNLNLPGEVFLIEQDEPDEDYDRVKSRTNIVFPQKHSTVP